MNTPEVLAQANDALEKVVILSNLNRAIILQYLHDNPNAIVSDLNAQLNMEQSAISQNLRVLRRANFVVPRRNGKNIHYRINYQSLGQASEAFSGLQLSDIEL